MVTIGMLAAKILGHSKNASHSSRTLVLKIMKASIPKNGYMDVTQGTWAVLNQYGLTDYYW
jgi:hypothetical protein